MKDNISHVELVRKYNITLQTSTEEKEYIICFDVPEMFTEFTSRVTKLVGDDVLNSQNSKYFINPIDYEFKKDGIYEKERDKSSNSKSVPLTTIQNTHSDQNPLK